MVDSETGKPAGKRRVAMLPRAVHLQRCRMPGWHDRCPRYRLWSVSDMARFKDLWKQVESQKIHQHWFSEVPGIELIESINVCSSFLEKTLGLLLLGFQFPQRRLETERLSFAILHQGWWLRHDARGQHLELCIWCSTSCRPLVQPQRFNTFGGLTRTRQRWTGRDSDISDIVWRHVFEFAHDATTLSCSPRTRGHAGVVYGSHAPRGPRGKWISRWTSLLSSFSTSKLWKCSRIGVECWISHKKTASRRCFGLARFVGAGQEPPIAWDYHSWLCKYEKNTEDIICNLKYIYMFKIEKHGKRCIYRISKKYMARTKRLNISYLYSI